MEAFLKIVDILLENEVQYTLISEMLGMVLGTSNNDEKTQIKEKLKKWVEITNFTDDEELSVKKFWFLVKAISTLLDYKDVNQNPDILLKIDNMIEFSKGQGDTAKSNRSKFNQMGFDCIFPPAFDLKMKYYQKNGNKESEKTLLEN
ncbi:hypothetical protein SCLARK_001815 [Spiroplasma clarkii]|uniref:hypothetical protein n=1 Tax=Spiroplasma clarkii TaxID=2139 RepID=UPI000B586B1C|nr:hypothetical protein [Spiroplasma clarkii]ARU92260.1 hypothetical protein SCLARK_001815 [Spiroplasma clarkii]